MLQPGTSGSRRSRCAVFELWVGGSQGLAKALPWGLFAPPRPNPCIPMIKFLLPLLAAAALAPLAQDTPMPKVKRAQVGHEAPHFRLNDQSGKATAIGGESQHWTVLAFFPKAATAG